MAEKWLKEENIQYEWLNIKEVRPSRELLGELLESGTLTRRRLFNTNGNLYKELGLKDQIDDLSQDKVLDLLQKEGMLIRRPFVTDGKRVTVGYKEETYEEIWQQ